MGKIHLAGALPCFLVSVAAAAQAGDQSGQAGMVKSASGEAFVLRDGRRVAVFPGFQVVQGDQLLTGDNGGMTVVFRDDTMLSLGPATEGRIDKFAFEPAENRLGMVLRVVHGMFEYLSGRISKMAPGSVRIETPVATLGVRGTRLVARIAP